MKHSTCSQNAPVSKSARARAVISRFALFLSISTQKNPSRTVNRIALFAALFGLFLALGQAAAAQSALDGFDPNADGAVEVVVVQTDGKILIGGSFTTVMGLARSRIARVNTDGTLDMTFNPDANGFVYTIAVQSDGKVLVGGDFTIIGGLPRSNIARLDATTGLADSWSPNANGEFVNSIVVQSDGKILVGGGFTTISGQARHSIVRLDATTGVPDSWNPNFSGGYVYSIAVLPDGRILAGGEFSYSGVLSFFARLDASTGVPDDYFFTPRTNGAVYSIVVQPDGKILVCGAFTNVEGRLRNGIARLDYSRPQMSQIDEVWNPNSGNSVLSIAVQSDGKVIAGGSFTVIGGQLRNRIARLDAVTGLPDSFNPNAGSVVRSIAVQSDGKILAGGSFTTMGGQTRNNIARLERDGLLDRTLDINTVGSSVVATAIQPDGKIIIGGSFTSVLGTPRNNIARLNTDGTLDTAFNPNANGIVLSIAVQSDGKILLGGFFSTLAPNGGAAVTRINIARVNADGTLDAAFDPNANEEVYSIAVQSDGKILLGGNFTSLSPNGGAAVTRNFIARVNADGTLDAAFDPNANSTVLSIAVQSDGKILLGGGFTTLSPNGDSVAVTRNRIARVNADGTLDAAFNPNANSSVYSIAVQSDGKILLGGAFFTTIGGEPRNRFARLSNDTAALSTLTVTNTTLTLTRDGSGAQFTRVIFEQSLDNGATYTTLGSGVSSLASPLEETVLQSLGGIFTSLVDTLLGRGTERADVGETSLAPQASGYTLGGQNIPTGQYVLIRARGFYRTGYQNGSETIEDKVQLAFLSPPTPTPTPTPTVTAVTPNSGTTAGGTAVTITGTNFTGTTGVTIGGNAATGVVVVNDTSITAVTPAGTAGTASVVVTTPDGANAANTLYTYVAPLAFTLTVSKTGSGTVTSSPAGIDCGAICEEEFDEDEEVTLTATPDTGSKFTGWNGGGCSGIGTCVVTMDEAKSVNADFALITISGSVRLQNAIDRTPLLDDVPVPDVELNADGAPPVSGSTNAAGNYSLSGFGAGPYTVTPSKADQDYQEPNGVFIDDASLVARRVVGKEPDFTAHQIAAADVSGNGSVSSYDASLIARWVVGLPDTVNRSGTWAITPSSVDHGPVTDDILQNYDALLYGDVNGDFGSVPDNLLQQLFVHGGGPAAVSLGNVYAQPGSTSVVPLKIENLMGASIRSYQFDIEYDPAVLTPAALAADLAGTVGAGMNIIYNVPRPGLLKVAVYNVFGVIGDGIYANLRFTAAGGAGSASQLKVKGFRFNDGKTPTVVSDGSFYVTNADGNTVRGRLVTAAGHGVRNTQVTIAGPTGVRTVTFSSSLGYFEFGSLAAGETYVLTVQSRRYRFAPLNVAPSDGLMSVEMVALE